MVSKPVADGHWVAVWAATPQMTENDDMPPLPFGLRDLAFHNSTIRQTLRVTTGGDHVRIRISNAFGLADLQLTAVTIATPDPSAGQRSAGSKSVLLDSIQNVTFSSARGTIVPRGALVVSDAVFFPIVPRQVITITMFLLHGQMGGDVTSHPGSRTDSWICHGDYTSRPVLDDITLCKVTHWYFLSGVEIWQDQQNSALVVVGDSLTDGRGSTDNGNDKWTDLLFNRMAEHPFARNVAVLNQAAGASRVLRDGKGSNFMSRLDRDVLVQSGLRYLMIYYGVNDIGTANVDVDSQDFVRDQLIKAFRQVVVRTHALGIPVFAATITPFMAPEEFAASLYSHPNRERTRQSVNHWIRTSGLFDAVIDFDSVLRDPKNEAFLKSGFNLGDYLHLEKIAFHTMADIFPLELFEMFKDGVCSFN